MSTSLPGRPRPRSKLFPVVLLLLLCAALALCWVVGIRYEQSRQPRPAAVPLSEEDFTREFPFLAMTRADHDTSAENAVLLDLSSCDGECLILDGGAYRLIGTLNGVIRVAAEEQTVRLILDSVTVTSPQGPALLVESAGKVILTLPEGSSSTFSDSGRYQLSAEEACVSSHSDLTINGPGALTVNGLYKDAVRSRNVIRIPEGQITVNCKRTGLQGADGILVSGGSLQISSEKYGLRTTRSGADGRGNLVISGGEHRIIAGRHAFLVGRADLYVFNCKIFDKSIVSTASVGGRTVIQSGCIR